MGMHNPAHPGEMLKELIITPLDITITEVAEHLNVSRKTLSKILNGRGTITPEMALRLELVFKNHLLTTGFACKMPVIFGTLAKIRLICRYSLKKTKGLS